MKPISINSTLDKELSIIMNRDQLFLCYALLNNNLIICLN